MGVAVGDGLDVWVWVAVGLLGVVTGVGVRVDVELGSGVADSVGVGESVEVDGEGVGVGETVVVPCCIEEGRVVVDRQQNGETKRRPKRERARPVARVGSGGEHVSFGS